MRRTSGGQLFLHVHVPKTAGTTINRILSEALGAGSHVLHDHVLQPVDELQRVVAESNWLAGHVPVDRALDAIKDDPREHIVLCGLREPKFHVISHYNWLIEIGCRGEQFFEDHPQRIKEVHHDIKSTDKTDPDAVIRTLQRYDTLFLNSQVKYVIGNRWSDISLSYKYELDQYDMILTSKEEVFSFASSLLGEGASSFEENRSDMHFDPAVFDTPQMLEFLADRNRADEALWRIVQHRKSRKRELS